MNLTVNTVYIDIGSLSIVVLVIGTLRSFGGSLKYYVNGTYILLFREWIPLNMFICVFIKQSFLSIFS